MADYYTQFSETLKLSEDEKIREEQKGWLETVFELGGNEPQSEEAAEFLRAHGIDPAQTDIDGGGPWPGFEYAFREGGAEEGPYLWVYSDSDAGNLENLAGIVRAFLQKWDPAGIFSFGWADTCNKMVAGAFCGGAAVVTAAEVRWMHAASWVDEQRGLMKGRPKTVRIRWGTAQNPEDSGKWTTHTFDTQAELDAFMKGVEIASERGAAADWASVEEVTDEWGLTEDGETILRRPIEPYELVARKDLLEIYEVVKTHAPHLTERVRVALEGLRREGRDG